MKRHIHLLSGLPAILLLLAATPCPARADGGVFSTSDHEFDVEMPAQKAILVWDEERGHEDLILSVELLGGPEAAWVVPVPSLPEVKAASPVWFNWLRHATRPRIEYQEKTVYENGQCVIIHTTEVDVEAGVDLISREEVGLYDVSILSADEPGALLDWLNDNGYAFPQEGGPILDAYVEEGGWFFVAARVRPGERANLEGDVQPLWFSFDVQRPVYPMRLTAILEQPVQVLIYVLADHRMDIQPRKFVTKFAGQLTVYAEPEDDTDLVELLTHRPYYTTKLSHVAILPEWMTEDLHVEQAASDESYHEVIYHTVYVCPEETQPPPTEVETEPPPIKAETEHAASEAPTSGSTDQGSGGSGWLVWGGGLVLLGLLAGLGLLWRRRSVRKPDEEQEA